MKKEKTLRNICKRTLDKGFERDWSVGLGAILGDGHTKLKRNVFVASENFQGKSESHVVLFRMYYNPRKLYQNSLW